ncbi:MAG: PepSY domain-containing protein [Candidatus Delongbacteria bacterium]|nr:PepSY domain-containing protein [Candidatus Delongbacteria bacterium]
MVHKRYKQYFKDYEILVAEYIFHEQGGYLVRANGTLIPDLNVKTGIIISKTEALNIALNKVNADEYMWQTNEINTDQYYPTSKLVISSKEYSLKKEDMRLVYQIDIYAKRPVARYNVEIDANTGEVINFFNKIHTADVSGSGVSLYNGTVSMTVDSLSISSTD